MLLGGGGLAIGHYWPHRENATPPPHTPHRGVTKGVPKSDTHPLNYHI